jgi:hypothetical protein
MIKLGQGGITNKGIVRRLRESLAKRDVLRTGKVDSRPKKWKIFDFLGILIASALK